MNLENKKQFATIILAAGLGLVAAFLTSQYVENNIKAQTQVLAREYQQRNVAVQEEMNAVKNELRKAMAAQAALQKQIQQIERQPPQVVVQQPTTPQGREVVDTTVFSTITPPGKRAVTILIDALSAVGGLVNPGDFVDVIAKLSIPEKPGDSEKSKNVTTVLFQNLQVLAVGTNFRPVGNSEKYKEQHDSRTLNVTLAVDPEEAGLLTFAQENGQLQLAIRPPTDLNTELLQVASWDLLADYALDRQGTEIPIPEELPEVKEVRPASASSRSTDDVKPFIEIFRGGQEL